MSETKQHACGCGGKCGCGGHSTKGHGHQSVGTEGRRRGKLGVTADGRQELGLRQTAAPVGVSKSQADATRD